MGTPCGSWTTAKQAKFYHENLMFALSVYFPSSKITHQQETIATSSHPLCIVIQIQRGSEISQIQCSELSYTEDLALSKGATGLMEGALGKAFLT